jgi:hypothetical protein
MYLKWYFFLTHDGRKKEAGTFRMRRVRGGLIKILKVFNNLLAFS